VNSVGSWAVRSAWKVVWEKDLRSQFACRPDIRKLIETTNSPQVLSHVLTHLDHVVRNLDLHSQALGWKTIEGRSLSKIYLHPLRPKPT